MRSTGKEGAEGVLAFVTAITNAGFDVTFHAPTDDGQDGKVLISRRKTEGLSRPYVVECTGPLSRGAAQLVLEILMETETSLAQAALERTRTTDFNDVECCWFVPASSICDELS